MWGHDVAVERGAITAGRACTESVAENSAKLSAAWAELLVAVQSLVAVLKQSLTAQRFFFEVAKVEVSLGTGSRVSRCEIGHRLLHRNLLVQKCIY